MRDDRVRHGMTGYQTELVQSLQPFLPELTSSNTVSRWVTSTFLNGRTYHVRSIVIHPGVPIPVFLAAL
jgi:hypothetical protein